MVVTATLIFNVDVMKSCKNIVSPSVWVIKYLSPYLVLKTLAFKCVMNIQNTQQSRYRLDIRVNYN